MKDNNKKYWKGIEELSNEPDFLKQAQNEFSQSLPKGDSTPENSGTDRRDFLKLLGFSVAAVSLAACEAPVHKAIPYLNKPEDVDPGVANWYASTYMEGGDYCSVLVRTREGRPVKIEGNSSSKVSMGGTSAKAQASVLSLYDNARLTSFTIKGEKKSKEEVDKQIIAKLNSLQGSPIRIVSSTILSPTTKKAIAEFQAKYTNTEHVMYDANSASGLLKANKASFGKAVVPSYDFSKANVIVSFGADFLGTWISPVEYTGQYAKRKKLGEKKKSAQGGDEFLINRHYQFETNLSLTGCSADYRTPIKPSEEGLYLAALYNAIAGNKLSVSAPKNENIARAAEDLKKNKGKSLVVSGSNDTNVQILVNEINKELGNYGNTIDINNESYQRQGDDEKMNAFIKDAKAGKVGAVIFYNANPVYDYPMGAELEKALEKISLTVSFADRKDETAAKVTYVCPDLHYLESWNDAMPKKGQFSLVQPTVTQIFKDTRAAQESLLIWAGNNTDYYTYLTNNWNQNILNGSSWEKALHDGLFESASYSVAPTEASQTVSSVDLSSIASAISSSKSSGLELKLYEKVGVGTGVQANNPWLQELPDPVSKATWGNYIAVPSSFAKEEGSDTFKYKDGDVFSLSVNGKEAFKLPILIQPGQAPNTISVAIGYGRTVAGKTAEGVGVNAYPLASFKNGTVSFSAGNIELKPTGDFDEIAQTQTHHTIMGRAIVQDSTLKEYHNNSAAGRYKPIVTTAEGKQAPKDVTLWYEHEKPNHLWGMVIDLNSCTGCSACVVACQAENNIPVVGKKEVLNRREMHWLRIDRYYSTPQNEITRKTFGDERKYFKGDMESWLNPEDNPEVTFQPMLCQQCNHAPCETVCPVAATTHSSEGLNQMAYNRCVGTRYCANNCPYKVRRFNWFKYFDTNKFESNPVNSSLGKMVLNPDVTVRSRGVMEKCTFCVQRIQDVKLTAKKEKRRPIDAEIETACSAACSSGAITFGDMNDTNSEVWNQLTEENKERAYTVLEELNTRPNIAYLTRIRNKKA